MTIKVVTLNDEWALRKLHIVVRSFDLLPRSRRAGGVAGGGCARGGRTTGGVAGWVVAVGVVSGEPVSASSVNRDKNRVEELPNRPSARRARFELPYEGAARSRPADVAPGRETGNFHWTNRDRAASVAAEPDPTARYGWEPTPTRGLAALCLSAPTEF